jgi:hypothetical protein
MHVQIEIDYIQMTPHWTLSWGRRQITTNLHIIPNSIVTDLFGHQHSSLSQQLHELLVPLVQQLHETIGVGVPSLTNKKY